MLIEPKVLKGFRDFLPAAEIERRGLIEKIEAIFRSFGFVPIDTPALEYAEILLGKGGGETEKQVYRFTDNGGRDVALRFDLTVPFARFVAEHRSALNLPFKRYHIAKVWRGENTQRGRYREFTQCDFDIIGSTSIAADFEILMLIRTALRAVGSGGLSIRINHRGIFNRFLARLDLQDKASAILRTVDKLAKIGRYEVLRQLGEIICDPCAEKILDFIESKGSFEEVLEKITEAAGTGDPETQVYSQRLSKLYQFMLETDTEDDFVLDPSITRGLDYYTGIVYETFLNDLPDIGSVCSGGRYDNLAGLYSKESISGVGSSIGLDRLIAAMEALGKISEQPSYTQVALIASDDTKTGIYQNAAQRFRAAGLNCEVLFAKDATEKLTKQYALAEKKGATWALSLDGEAITLRNLSTREDSLYASVDDAVQAVLARN